MSVRSQTFDHPNRLIACRLLRALVEVLDQARPMTQLRELAVEYTDEFRKRKFWIEVVRSSQSTRDSPIVHSDYTTMTLVGTRTRPCVDFRSRCRGVAAVFSLFR
jgi:hypothetical protein